MRGAVNSIRNRVGERVHISWRRKRVTESNKRRRRRLALCGRVLYGQVWAGASEMTATRQSVNPVIALGGTHTSSPAEMFHPLIVVGHEEGARRW